MTTTSDGVASRRGPSLDTEPFLARNDSSQDLLRQDGSTIRWGALNSSQTELEERLRTVCLVICAGGVLSWGLAKLKFALVPLVLSLALKYLLQPMIDALTRRKTRMRYDDDDQVRARRLFGGARRRRGGVAGARWRRGDVAAASFRCARHVDIPWTRVAAPPRVPRGYSVEACRGDAAGAAWIFRGGESRRRRGCRVDIPWRRVAATRRIIWGGRGPTVETPQARWEEVCRKRGPVGRWVASIQRRCRRVALPHGIAVLVSLALALGCLAFIVAVVTESVRDFTGRADV